MSNDTKLVDNRNAQQRKPNIVITGFGVFRDHAENPSWEAIRDGRLRIEHDDVNVILRQIEVAYATVDEEIPKLWQEYDPLLMIHVGLAAMKTCIQIEGRARHGPFIHDDVRGQAPDTHLRQHVPETDGCLEEGSVRHKYVCKPCQFDYSTTCVNIDQVCSKMNELYKVGRVMMQTRISEDAGLYVCEYIYQKSLQICDRSVFIHIPDTSTYKLADLSTALSYVVNILIDQVKSCK